MQTFMDTLLDNLRNHVPMVPDEYDGSYELVKATVAAYDEATIAGATHIDVELIYLMTVGTWDYSADKKREKIDASSALSDEKKMAIKNVLERIEEKARNGEYANSNENGGRIGMFGSGRKVFRVSDEVAKRLISALVKISSATDKEEARSIAEACFRFSIPDMQAGAASQILHCLKPDMFPILNGQGRTGYGRLLGWSQDAEDKAKKLENYIEACNEIDRFFTDKQIAVDNYRIVDVLLDEMYQNMKAAQAMNNRYNGRYIWKISHGYQTFDKKEKDHFLEERIVTMHGNTGKKQGERFKNEVKKGDLFYLCWGSKQVLLIGKIASDEILEIQKKDKSEGWVGRRYEVLYESQSNEKFSGTRDGWSPSGQTTLVKIDQDEQLNQLEHLVLVPYFSKTLAELFNENPQASIPQSKQKGETAVQTNDKIQLNTILYGPPGTGKTYHTAIYAVAICENKSVDEVKSEVEAKGYQAVYDRYQKLVDKGRVCFTTFHQSYGYEDFIEGIKPDVDENGNVTYRREDGVFKAFCFDFDEAWDQFIANVKKNGNKVTVKMKTKDRNLEWSESNQKFEIADWEKSKGQYYAGKSSVKALFEGTFERKNGSGSNDADKDTSAAILNKLQEEYGLENKVFIIDEINRGNISKIFGELITLIEDDKRGVASVVLPYEKKPFTVPKNIYILGTMNTADRSIALLDTALRRRFDFVEMLPEPEVLKDAVVDGVSVKALLEGLNERVEFLYDREHTIGHAYFKALLDAENCKDLSVLKSIFEKKIIPLLQEYFYDDYEKIKKVLVGNFMKEKGAPRGWEEADGEVKYEIDLKALQNADAACFKKMCATDEPEQSEASEE